MKIWPVTIVISALLQGVWTSVVEAAPNVKESNSWSETYPVTTTSPQLEISNIWGDVRVRVGKSDEITVSATEVRSAPNQRLFDRSKESINLEIETTGKRVSMIVGDSDRRWNKMNQCRGCRVEYQFDITVPAQAVVDVSTVNDGKIDVSGVAGIVNASNVNGSVSVADMANCENINTVNGPIDVTYAKAPTSDCEFNTINGDVSLGVPTSTSLSVSVDLFNGKISSELPIEPFGLPAKVEKVKKDGRQKFLIQKQTGFSIGAGGPVYTISSMNGDVRILKKQ